MAMKIWVDADSCPKQVRVIIVRAANKKKILAYFVANRPIALIAGEYLVAVECEKTDQAADNYILERALPGDLVITRDIPLAKQLVDAGITVINDRGEEFNPNTINTRLSIRNFMYELNAAGLKPESTARFNKKDTQKFAACFDTVLHRLLVQNAPCSDGG